MPNKVYTVAETAVTWTDTGGDYALDCGGLAAAAGRVGAQGDLGASSRSRLYSWRIVIDGFTAAPVVGEAIDIYLATGDGTYVDGSVGTSDAALTSANQLPLLMYLGSAVVRSTTAGDQLIATGFVRLSERYVSPVIFNNTASSTLKSTSDAHKFILTPVPSEVQ